MLSATLVRERQTPYDFTYMWNLKNNINKPTKQNRLIDAESGLRVDRVGEGCRAG